MGIGPLTAMRIPGESQKPLPIIGVRRALMHGAAHDDDPTASSRKRFTPPCFGQEREANPRASRRRRIFCPRGEGPGRMAGTAENAGPPASDRCHRAWQWLAVWRAARELAQLALPRYPLRAASSASLMTKRQPRGCPGNLGIGASDADGIGISALPRPWESRLPVAEPRRVCDLSDLSDLSATLFGRAAVRSRASPVRARCASRRRPVAPPPRAPGHGRR